MQQIVHNPVDGIYAANNNALFDPRFHYNTIDLKGTVNLSNGTVVLPGVRTGYYPSGGTYPATDIHRAIRAPCRCAETASPRQGLEVRAICRSLANLRNTAYAFTHDSVKPTDPSRMPRRRM